MDDVPVLKRMAVHQIVDNWRPGSQGSDWTWADERRDLQDDPATERIRQRVDAEGIGFIDYVTPILLGNDCRVWDGHHRLIIALERGIEFVDVEVVR
jgi:hypothetical protein